ncbi:Protein of unknown function (DUF3095) [Fragilaria crotonensis]|nr:Protein of unknown function (DUF3095) [Fragilaria crotonensis]
MANATIDLVDESINCTAKSEDIYKNLKSFDDFSQVTNAENYVRLPSDWAVVVARVVGTTEAVKAGRYRDVNTIGAACITAVKNALGVTVNDFLMCSVAMVPKLLCRNTIGAPL